MGQSMGQRKPGIPSGRNGFRVSNIEYLNLTFLKTCDTTWAYTRLGHISDKSAEEMKALLGNGNVTLTLEMGE